MAHNNTTVNSFEPNVNSEINFTTSIPTILIGRNYSQDYDSNTASPTLTAGSTLYFYDTSPINTINSATITSSNDWTSGVTLPAGTYVMSMLFSCVFSASGSIQFGFKVGSTWQGTIAGCGGLENVYLNGSGVSVNTKTLTTSTSYTFNVFSSSNVATIANQGSVPSEQSYVLIQKMS